MLCYIYSPGKRVFSLCLPWFDSFFQQRFCVQKLVTADFVSPSTDFRCKLVVTKCPERAFTLILFLLLGGNKVLGTNSGVVGRKSAIHLVF